MSSGWREFWLSRKPTALSIDRATWVGDLEPGDSVWVAETTPDMDGEVYASQYDDGGVNMAYIEWTALQSTNPALTRAAPAGAEAEATATARVVETPVTVVRRSVELTLSEAEAELLTGLLVRVNGPSAPREAAAVLLALRGAGVREAAWPLSAVEGTVHFS